MIMNQSVRKTVEQAGLCRLEDPEIFTTEKAEHEAKAKSICAGCPVREACLEEYWWETGVVVGGTTTKERRKRIARLDIPHISRDRLVESHLAGGIRAVMLECSLDEDQATHAVKALKRLGAT